jgi:hydroxymethylbilane synthase
MKDRLVIGTRKSALALWQSGFIKSALEAAFPSMTVELRHIVTSGDRTQESNIALPAIGGKGLFTAELEEALVKREIDLAVHSLKDLPTELPAEFVIGAIPARGSAADAFMSRSGKTLAQLPAGAVVGTSSLRRSSQILRARPDLATAHIRGNVDTRLRKLRAEGGEFDAIVLAEAGLQRLGLEGEITEILSDDIMLPAPGQGALAVECRASDRELHEMLSLLHEPKTAAEVAAERSFLRALDAGCNTPVAARAIVTSSARLHFRGRCVSPDGKTAFEVETEGLSSEAEKIGQSMAQEARQNGFVVAR